MSVNLKSKLSLKTIVGKIDIKKLHADGKAVDLFNVGGTAHGIKSGSSNFGDWNSFVGQFAAIKLADGEVFRGAQLFLPKIAEDFVMPTVMNAGGQPVEFAFIVGVQPAKKTDGSDSYEYTVKPILEADQVDPLEAMVKKLMSHAPKALTASEETVSSKSKKA